MILFRLHFILTYYGGCVKRRIKKIRKTFLKKENKNKEHKPRGEIGG